MKAVSADFSSPPQPPRWAWALLVLALAAAGALAVSAWQARQALGQAQMAQQQRVEAALADAKAGEPVPQAAPAYEASALQFLAERSAPWPQALRVLENVQVPGVQVQALDHGSADQLVRVEVTAPGHAAAVEFLMALNAGVEGRCGDVQWVLARSIAAEGQVVRAQLAGRKIP
jgi:hypothetical protein